MIDCKYVRGTIMMVWLMKECLPRSHLSLQLWNLLLLPSLHICIDTNTLWVTLVLENSYTSSYAFALDKATLETRNFGPQSRHYKIFVRCLQPQQAMLGLQSTAGIHLWQPSHKFEWLLVLHQSPRRKECKIHGLINFLQCQRVKNRQALVSNNLCDECNWSE